MIKKLKINSSYLLRFGFIDENSSGDFIDNIDGFIDHIDNVTFDNCGDYTYGTGVDDEPRPNDSVESFTKSYFVYTGLTTQCEAINIDSDTGKVEYMGGTYDSLAEFYGCDDEDQESIQGIRIRD